MSKHPTNMHEKKYHKQSLIIIMVFLLVLVPVFKFRNNLFNNVTSVLKETRVVGEKPEDTTGFRLLQRIPEKDGPTLDYEIRLKFSEPISVDDFDVRVDKPGFKLKKVVVTGQPDTLWVLPEVKWVYDLPYNLTVRSTNPDKKLKSPIYIRYIFEVWDGPPQQMVGKE